MTSLVAKQKVILSGLFIEVGEEFQLEEREAEKLIEDGIAEAKHVVARKARVKAESKPADEPKAD